MLAILEYFSSTLCTYWIVPNYLSIISPICVLNCVLHARGQQWAHMVMDSPSHTAQRAFRCFAHFSWDLLTLGCKQATFRSHGQFYNQQDMAVPILNGYFTFSNKYRYILRHQRLIQKRLWTLLSRVWLFKWRTWTTTHLHFMEKMAHRTNLFWQCMSIHQRER